MALPRNGIICLAGFMRILAKFIIHPALLPAFPGMDAQKQATVQDHCDDAKTLNVEHKLYPKAIQMLASKKTLSYLANFVYDLWAI